MLIGCEVFFELLRPNKFRWPCEKWLFQETGFGYIVAGSSDKFEEKSYCGLAINLEINSNSLNQQLEAFWEIEMVNESSIEHNLEEEICETQYQYAHYRTEEGCYVVQLPAKKDPYCLVNSRFLAEIPYGAVLYAQSISEEDVSTRLLCSVPCCTSETNHCPSFGIVCLCVIITAPGKDFTFPDATYTANNIMD
ncbi:uncharacterized protein TNIN_242061 [Trichonephila inaurata madagascariensis]|uniref:Uncharacterized protein n=1 Tax=Trichonephila inaurata madagascariensis TaxID=2747483 RepID=A0A8X6WZJ4_9ARAC|nr:uncharacterized protein TNIN_242061 [Trichonephila inaurata madagascariensis]